MTPEFYKRFNSIINFSNDNKIFLFLIIFSIFLFFFFPIQWTDNELHYYGMAQSSYGKLSENYSSFHYTKLKFLIGYLHGYLINLIGYEKLWFYLRILTLLIYSILLTQFADVFKFNNIAIIISLIFFIFFGQNFTGGGWLFQGFESKIISYLIFFYSFSLLINEKYKLFFILSLFSIYAHFQAAFFCILFNFLFFAFYKKDFIKILKLILLLSIFSIPLFYYIFLEMSYITSLDINKVFYNRVYSQSSVFNLNNEINFRDKIGIFLTSFLIFIEILYIRLEKHKLDSKYLSLIKCALIFKTYLIIAIIFDFFFRESLSTFFIYRPSSISLIITLFIFFEFVYKYFLKLKNFTILIVSSSVIIFLTYQNFFFLKKSIKIFSNKLYAIGKTFDYIYHDDLGKILNTDEEKTIKWITDNTSKSDVFLIEENVNSYKHYINLRPTSFEKNVKRPTLINNHNIFGSKRDIERWYNLNNLKADLFKGDCKIIKSIKVNYLLFFDNNNSMFLEKKCKFLKVYSSSNLSILKVLN